MNPKAILMRALWLGMFPVMAFVVIPLHNLTTAIREWWETY